MPDERQEPFGDCGLCSKQLTPRVEPFSDVGGMFLPYGPTKLTLTVERRRPHRLRLGRGKPWTDTEQIPICGECGESFSAWAATRHSARCYCHRCRDNRRSA